jgi:hypothetical protein
MARLRRSKKIPDTKMKDQVLGKSYLLPLLAPLPLPRVYPFHQFENMPPFAACSFQLARRAVISGSVESRFWDCRLAKRPAEEPPELERRRSLTVGMAGEPFALLAVFDELEVVESFIVVRIGLW